MGLLVDRKKRNILDHWGNNNNDDTNDNGIRFKATTELFRLINIQLYFSYFVMWFIIIFYVTYVYLITVRE